MIELDTPEAFKIPPMSTSEAWAIRMLEEGIADAYNQRLALSTILTKLCRAYDCHFVPESDRESAFLEGRGFVGQQITKILRMDPNALNEIAKEEKNNAR